MNDFSSGNLLQMAAICVIAAVLFCALLPACSDKEPEMTADPPMTRADSIAAGLIILPPASLTADTAWAGEDEFTF